MEEQYNATQNSKEHLPSDNKLIDNEIYNESFTKNNIPEIKCFLFLFLIPITSIAIFVGLFFIKIRIKASDIYTNKIICEDGLFIPEDDQTKCIECSMENCSKCFGSRLNNNCIKCNSGLNPIYENNKIISCSICKKGYYLINDECRLNYTFKAIYKSDGEEVKLINYNISEIKEMIIDGEKVEPSTNYLFNDTQYHEVSMLLDVSKYLNSTFEGIKKMISISFNPYFDTLNIINMNYMFFGCSSLTSINLSNFDTSKVTDMHRMFYGCSSLTSINLSNFNTLNANDISHMFYGCSSLKSINLNNFDTSKVTDISAMFYGCSSLTSISLSHFYTSNVELMDNLFYGCSSLKSIDLSNFNTSKINYVDGLFYNCFSLESINLSKFNTSNVTNMAGMLFNCSSLKSIDLSNFDSSKVTDMKFMFYNCSSLTSINLSSFKTSIVKNMRYMFYNCSSLTSINLSNFDTSRVENMNGMFFGCTSLQYLNILNFSSSNSSYNFSLFNKPFNGTIEINENFTKHIDMTYINGWNKNKQ